MAELKQLLKTNLSLIYEITTVIDVLFDMFYRRKNCCFSIENLESTLKLPDCFKEFYLF